MKYVDIITLFLKYNPDPSDAQIHNLADALGVDVEELEAVAYEMLSTELHSVGILSDVQDAYEGLVPEDEMDIKEVLTNDGYFGENDVRREQRLINNDGAMFKDFINNDDFSDTV